MTTPPALAEPDLRTRLLEAAEVEVVARGAGEVSLRAIARRAGVSHQAPGHFFGNRAGLLTALAIYALAKLRVRMETTAVESAALPARQRLSRLGVTYIHFARDNQALFGLTLRADAINSADEQLTAERIATWAVLLDAVSEAQQDGWRADEPREHVALMCWTIVHGAAVASGDGLLQLQFPHLSLDEVAQTVTDRL